MATTQRRFGTLPSLLGGVEPTESKVPAITASFWAAKLATTAMGEAASDWSVHTFPPAAAVLVGAVLFAVAVLVQLRRTTYSRWAYWGAVSMVGVFGTMVADVAHVGLHIPYAASTAICAIVLAAVFVLWHRTEGTLSISSITTRARECWYWAAVVATFAFGTAAGDLSAITLHVGYFGSIWCYLALICVPALAFAATERYEVLTFWSAYVLTRPLGASVADWIGVSHARGGLAAGPGLVAAVGLCLIGAIVAGSARSAKESSARGS
jgi:uncharacterized membrane-anchored protein